MLESAWFLSDTIPAPPEGGAMKSILVPIEDHDRMDAVLATTLIAARLFDSYIEGLPLGPDIAGRSRPTSR